MFGSKIAVLSLVLAFSGTLVRADQLPFSVSGHIASESSHSGGSQKPGLDTIWSLDADDLVNFMGKASNDTPADPSTETIVSLLSASSQHTILLHLLQRAKCIPLLARIGNATLFAPTDSAWEDWAARHKEALSVSEPYQNSRNARGYSEGTGKGDRDVVRPQIDYDGPKAAGWLGTEGLDEWKLSHADALALRLESGTRSALEEERALDNQNWALRQHLLYHMLNYTLSPASFLAAPLSGVDLDSEAAQNLDVSTRRNITTLTTLLHPIAKQPPLPPIPEPGSPWLPTGGEGMLGGKGQRLRLARGGSAEGGERGRVGGDWKGEGGVSIWQGDGWKNDDGNVTPADIGISEKGRKGDDKKDKERDKVKGIRWGENGAVVGVEGVLDMPPSIEEIIHSHPSLTYLASLLPKSSAQFGGSNHPYSHPPHHAEDLPSPLPANFSTSEHLTIFAPTNEAFAIFDDVEKRYLEGEYGGEALARVMGGGVVEDLGKKQVGWGDYWGAKGDNVVSVTGCGLEVSSTQTGDLVVNGSKAEQVDIFASNGVIHIIPNLLVPDNFVLLNSAEKVLLSHNATRFVSLLRSANLSDTYVGAPNNRKKGDEEEAWTILAPVDEVLDVAGRGGAGRPIPHAWAEFLASAVEGDVQMLTSAADDGLIEAELAWREAIQGKDASPLAALLQYHIIPGRYLPRDLKDGMLVGSELRTKGLLGGRQRLRVDVSERFDKTREGWDSVDRGEIRFGGVAVVGKPVKSGESVIYLLSSLLAPPEDVLQTAVSDLQLSTFIAAVYAANLDHAVKTTPGITYFMPRNKAFNALGLAMRYLLLPEGKDELRRVVKYHAVAGIVYTPDMQEGRETYKTLHGGEIVLTYTVPDAGGSNETQSGAKSRPRQGDGSPVPVIQVSSPNKWEGHDSGEKLPANGEIRPAQVMDADALTSTGVIQVVDSVVMPADVSITIRKLIRGAKQNTMVDLMERVGLAWVLDGREPTREEVDRVGLRGVIRTMDDGNSEQPEPDIDIDSLALPGYTLLVPSDSAFSHLNLTYYLLSENEPALLELLKLHIVPTQSSIPRTQGTKEAASAPRDGHPLSLDDDLVYQSLLSATSRYGDLAVRATGDEGYLVGVRGARGGGYGQGGARMGEVGRASVRWRKSKVGSRIQTPRDGGLDKVRGVQGDVLWRGGMTLGGGVVMIDNVLIPYEPSWFTRWGWLVITLSGIGAILLIAGLVTAWWCMTRGKQEVVYEPLEGEEEE